MSNSNSATPRHRHYWIENEGLLRDEGVLFGLSGMNGESSSKLDAIRSYYGEQIARLTGEHEALQKRRDALRSKKSDIEKQIEELRGSIREPEIEGIEGANRSGVARHNLVRYVLGFALSTVICGANFFLVHELLSPHFGEPFWVAVGVFAAGLFALYSPASMLFISNEMQQEGRGAAELWKMQLIEFGMPIAASSFVVIWSVETLTVVQSVGLFIYLTMVFLAGGKLLLSTLPQLALVLRVLRRDWKVWRFRRAARKEIEELKTALDALSDREATVDEQEEELDTIEALSEARDTAISTFTSEYELARHAKAQGFLTGEDIDQIISRAGDTPTSGVSESPTTSGEPLSQGEPLPEGESSEEATEAGATEAAEGDELARSKTTAG